MNSFSGAASESISRRIRFDRHYRIGATLLVLLSVVFAACNKLEKPKTEPYYAEPKPPRKQEFRWSNGKAPRSMDPARAATPPETDLVRAVYEGLTELDARTLDVRPALAERWTSSDDNRTWTFYLRGSAVWSNGEPVTAQDFVRSWVRVGSMGKEIPHRDLLTNIVGLPIAKVSDTAPNVAPTASNRIPGSNELISPERQADRNTNSSTAVQRSRSSEVASGLTALDANTLQVTLIAPDKDFPKLVAHPMFRPVFSDTTALDGGGLNTTAVTNGAFKISSVDESGNVFLKRSETYWNRQGVDLESVHLLAFENAEAALQAYRAGEIDAVTNAEFAPLAVKLLEPFEDFRRRTHAAVNFYEINHEKPPFDDRRVREALAISIERERLTEGEMEGKTQPALSFLPFGGSPSAKITQDKEKAVDLLSDAGFPEGNNFPVIKLVINRNYTQERIARAVARMWKENLKVETEVVIKENAQVEEARNAGDFDLVRRNTVFPTADELMSILAILRPPKPELSVEPTPTSSVAMGVEAADPSLENARSDARETFESPDVTMSEANAVYELWAIPLYFPTSYSLVKPYVTGFEMNSLDAPLLQDVSIDSNWQPK